MNDEARSVYGLGAAARSGIDHIAIEIQRNQVRRGDLVESQAESVYQEVIRFWDPGRDVVPDNVGKAEYIRKRS
jgi:hypothetical protein